MRWTDRLRNAVLHFMQGRHGVDQLGMFTLLAGLGLSLAGSFSGLGLLSLTGTALYIVTVFRMLSRNSTRRIQENQKYLSLTSGIKTSCTQFIRRQKNRKEYKFFKCPQCHVLLRLKRGTGEKEITCPKCGHQFNQKA